MSLSGQKVVVIGGTSGIGFATAKAAHEQGADVVLASRDEQRVEDAVAALGRSARGKALDTSDEGQVQAFFRGVGSFDHLVYTAGETLRLTALDDLNFDEAQAFFRTRFWGAFMAAKHAHGHMRAGGSITLTNGTAGLRPGKAWTVAASICGAMESLTRALAVELAPIRVNSVCPGVVKTDLWKGLAEADREAMYRNLGERLLVGRVGEAQDLAETYLYLMQQRYGTGQVIVVDGGGVLV